MWILLNKNDAILKKQSGSSHRKRLSDSPTLFFQRQLKVKRKHSACLYLHLILILWWLIEAIEVKRN